MNLVELFSLTEYKPPKPLTYVKSPLNYIGGKYRLLSQILPLFPKEINTFVDLFCGGCNVGINVKSNHTICNDLNNLVIEIFEYLNNHSLNEVLSKIDSRIEEFNLSKTNEEGFKKFRDLYNQNPNPLDLYVLGSYSYNNQFRFNNDLQYNSSFGRDRSEFTSNMRKNLTEFVTRLKTLRIEFTHKDFTSLDLSFLTPDDFVYADPPYIISTGNYNDGNRGFKNWGLEQEQALLDILSWLSSKRVRFALSNVFEHKGKTNDLLIQWASQYNVHEIKSSYSHASYNTKGGSREVLVTNY